MRSGIALISLGIFICLSIESSKGTNHVNKAEWDAYKLQYNKNYVGAGVSESLAQYYYSVNKKMIEKHNALYARGQRTYSLRINQFTDMRLIHFNALFPVAKPLPISYATPPPAVNVAPPTYNPFTSFGFRFNVEDQGTKCNSGWSYSSAKSVEILQAVQMGILNPVSLSAQNLIDCSGRATACRTQVPQTAFDYLTRFNMLLLTVGEYPNNNAQSEPGMCVARGTSNTRLAQYSTLATDDDFSLKAYVGAGYPVIVEFNPTSFEFMHYAEGVFQPPRFSTKGTHFMVVVGYDRDAIRGEDYWILQNSFGSTWGENGLMRLTRSSTLKVGKSPIFPTILA